MIDFELFMHEILYVMTWKFFKCVKKHIYLRTKREVLWLQTENALWNSFTIWWELRSYHLLALLNVVPSKAFFNENVLNYFRDPQIHDSIVASMLLNCSKCTYHWNQYTLSAILPYKSFEMLRNFTIAHA